MDFELLRVVTVAYNPGDELALCAESLLEATGADVDFVIVDNGTEHGVVDAVARAYGASVVRPGRNLGYGSAANRGAAFARKASAGGPAPSSGETAPSGKGGPRAATGSPGVWDGPRAGGPAQGSPGAQSAPGRAGDWLVVVNPDVVFMPGSIDRLLEETEAWPRGGAFGPLIRDRSGEVYPSARRFPRLVSGAGHALLVGVWPANPFSKAYREHADVARSHAVDWLSGACLLLRREAFEEVGGFDESYFMFFEDTQLGEQLAAAGWQSVYVPGAEVVHEQGASWKERPERMLRAHHRSAMRYLDGVYDGPLRAPLRWALRAGLRAREEVQVRLARGGRASDG